MPDEFIKELKGIPVEKLNKYLKILFFQIKILNGNFSEPKIYYGFF